MTGAFTREDADALRDAADVLMRRSRNPRIRAPLVMTYLAVTAADLKREADRIEDEIAAARHEAGAGAGAGAGDPESGKPQHTCGITGYTSQENCTACRPEREMLA